MTESLNTQVWRLRMNAHGSDFTERSWDAGELGIWYGAWTAEDLEKGASLAELNDLPAQQRLEWDVTGGYYNTAHRFCEIAATEWVLVYLKSRRCLGLAQLSKLLLSRQDHELNLSGEIFKFRKITSKKLFKIDELPDAYQLLAAQGQANVFNFRSMHQHVAALVRYDTSHDLVDHLKQLELPDLLDFLGASGWETFCMAYLITEEGFLPTGLSPGRTLAVLDLVGRSQRDGKRIYAQCKKSPAAINIDDNFLALAALEQDSVLFFCAYGGILKGPPPHVRVFSKTDALAWADTPRGKSYVSLLV